MGKIVKLNPFICEKIWGGSKLASLKGLSVTKKVGETWEVSTHENGSSKIGEVELNSICQLSYLVKFLDTSDNLSIQVHPDDEYCKEFPVHSVKNECWLILDTERDSVVYLGFKKNVTKKEFINASASGMAVDHFLNKVPARVGDFIVVPAGTVHAIGSGITLCEVQQTSDSTFRVWDWNRKGQDGDIRPLHLEEAKETLNFTDDFNEGVLEQIQGDVMNRVGISTLIDTTDFKVQLYSKMTQKKMEIRLAEKESIILLTGEIKGDVELTQYQSAFILEEGIFQFEVNHDTAFLLVSEK